MATLKNLFTYPNNSATDHFNPTYYGAVINATQIETGQTYYIKVVGDPATNWTSIGAANANIGTFFTANTTTPTGAGTVYIAQSGILGRFLDLKDGDYISWPVTYWGSTAKSTLISSASQYINYYNDSSAGYTTNLSMHSFVVNPLTRFTKTTYNKDLDARFARINSSNKAIYRIQTEALTNLVDGDRVGTSKLISSSNGTVADGTGDYYVKKISDQFYELYTNSGLTTPYDEGLSYVNPARHPIFINDAGGVRLLMPHATNAANSARTDYFANYNGDASANGAVKFRNNNVSTGQPCLTNTSQGSMNSNNTSFYGNTEVVGLSNITFPTSANRYKNVIWYTSNNRIGSNLASLTEEYYATLTVVFGTNTGNTGQSLTHSIALGNAGYSAGTQSSIANLRTKLAQQQDVATGFGTSFARIAVSGGADVTNSAFQSANGVNIPVGASHLSDMSNFWVIVYDANNDTIRISRILDKSSSGTSHEGWRNLTGGNTTLTIKIIDPAQLKNATNDVTVMVDLDNEATTSPQQSIAESHGSISTVNKFFISGKTDILPGIHKYSYKNATNQTAFGATWGGTYYEPGGTIQNMSTANIPEFQPVVNGAGYLTGYQTLGAFSNGVGGIWNNGTEVWMPVVSKASEYIVRTPTVIENEDTFDTQDYWVDTGFASGQKEWPTNVRPNSAKVTYIQPSTSSVSQSGKKYVRSSSFAKYKLDLTYPPMLKEDFEEFNKVALAVQGQAIPFYVMLSYGNKHILWNNNYTGTSIATQINTSNAAGSSVTTFGGFETNEVDAFHDGEHVIFGSNTNGNLRSIITEQDANIYGEVKVRFSHPATSTTAFGQLCYKNPVHAIVTLAGDEFEYSIDEFGYYLVNVSMDLDGFK